MQFFVVGLQLLNEILLVSLRTLLLFDEFLQQVLVDLMFFIALLLVVLQLFLQKSDFIVHLGVCLDLAFNFPEF